MAGDLLSALLGGSSRSSYSPLESALYSYSDSPFNMAAQGIAKSSPYLYSPFASSGRNLATGVGSGLLAALLGGIGQSDTDAKNKALLAAANEYTSASPESRASIIEANPRLAAFGAATQMDEKKRQQEAEAQRLKAEQELQMFQNKEDYKLSQLPMKEQIKGMYNPSGTKVKINLPPERVDGIGELPAEIQTKAAVAESLADEMMRIERQIAKTGTDYKELKGGQFISALDEHGIATDLVNVADRFVRNRTGAAARPEEESTAKRIIQGDLTVGPRDIQKFLRAAAASELRWVKSQYEHGQKRGNPELYMGSLNEKIDSIGSLSESLGLSSGRPGPGWEKTSDGKAWFNPKTGQFVIVGQ